MTSFQVPKQNKTTGDVHRDTGCGDWSVVMPSDLHQLELILLLVVDSQDQVPFGRVCEWHF